MRSHVRKGDAATGKIALSIVALCLFAGCDASCSEPEQNTHLPKAANPHPADGAKGVSPDTRLTWSGDESAASYNVYFGTESPRPFVRNQTQNIFDPGPLDWDQTYYWKIDIVGCQEGNIWKFTTFWYGDPNAEEMDVRFNDEDAKRIMHSFKNCLAQVVLSSNPAAFSTRGTQIHRKKYRTVALPM